MTPFSRLPPRWPASAAQAVAGGLPLLAVAPVVIETNLLHTVLVLVLLVICLGIHEAAHAWVAWKCGDSTARDLGRITLNPLVHIDPIMTVLLPLLLLWVTNGQFAFGGAKPVPVNFHRLRHPWRDMSLVAVAGPASNFALAVLFMAARHFFVTTGLYNGANESEYLRRLDLLPSVLMAAVGFNLALTLFNLLPIPPLDGSRLMAWLLPDSLRQPYVAIERFGLLLVILVASSGEFTTYMLGAVRSLSRHIETVVTLGGAW